MPGSHRPPRFRCRVGHAWTAVGLLDEQGEVLEGALWMALRSLEEKAALSLRMAESATSRGNGRTAERYSDVSSDAAEAGRVIRRLIEQLGSIEDKTPVTDQT
jgi:two-component system chemotaxis response regulator CheB